MRGFEHYSTQHSSGCRLFCDLNEESETMLDLFNLKKNEKPNNLVRFNPEFWNSGGCRFICDLNENKTRRRLNLIKLKKNEKHLLN
jgi:hypothetical protein